MHYSKLVDYLDDYLQIAAIEDYGPQGLQVEAGKEEVKRIALTVDTAPKTIEAAAGWQADMLLVHHGILWRDVQRIAGPFGARVRALLDNGIHLYAAHLALDAHREVGNNAVLARMLQVEVEDWWCEVRGTSIGVLGRLNMSREQLLNQVSIQLQTEARLLAYGPEKVQRIAIISGFGADRVAEASRLGADTLLTGETSHANYWAADDWNVNVIFAGHYASETIGVRALGAHLAKKFDLEVHFLDFPTKM